MHALTPGAMAAGFGLQRFNIAATNQNSSPDVQAGSHPYALTTTFTLNEPHPFGEKGALSEGSIKDAKLELPSGFVGNSNATPKCSYSAFVHFQCPNDTVVGQDTTYDNTGETEEVGNPIERAIFHVSTAVYNLEPPPGVAAEFGFQGFEVSPVFLDASVRTGGDYGITVDARNLTQAAAVYASKVTIWGVPADPSHDSVRGTCLGSYQHHGVEGLLEGENETEGPSESEGECPVSVPAVPLLTNPTSCGVPRSAKFNVDSWENPGNFTTGENVISKTATLPELSGCDRLDFSPTIEVTPDGTAGSTPTGLDVNVHVPQESMQNPMGLAEGDVKDTTVTLPAGVQLSPSAADGLQACSQTQIGLDNAEKPSCPDASKVATVKLKSPLLERELEGAVYLASPQNFAGPPENPFSSLVALYLVAEDPVAGVLVKLAGKVTSDPITGQLTTAFENTPQLPYSELKLVFFGTARAPLTTPALCGTYTATTSFAPWSGTPPVAPSSSFQITSGPAGAPCSDPLPFTPGFQAGTTNIQAGAFTPFRLTMTRPDGDQTLSRLEMHMPPGLLGTLSHVTLCPEPQANAGTCGPESLIGHTIVSAGLGNDPFTVTGGKVYITTAYGGGQYGLSIVNPAAAGPFVLEEGRPVIVRAAIFVDPDTAALTVKSGPIPTILDGIPLQIQRVNVTIERPNFTFNPTNCSPLSVGATIASTAGASAPVSSPFQAANCANLPFKPSFTASTQGKTSKANGASLIVKVAQKPGEANIHKVDLTLPKILPARLTTLQKACTEAQFNANPAGCPVASSIGTARAVTPVLRVPLTGPAYLVSHGGAAFPDVEFVLQGEGVEIVLDGGTDIKKGITYSRFETVPDAPISSFETNLPEGPHSALAANGNLCATTAKTVSVRKRMTVRVHGRTKHVTKTVREVVAQPLTMPTTITGQNGAQIAQNTRIGVTGCLEAEKKATKKGRGNKQHKANGRKK
jgi:hypothetical protein